MIYLFLSVFTSSIILVIFKGFDRFKVDIFQAIIWNYVVAFSLGFTLYGHEWNSQALEVGNWKPYAFTCGVLFISLFYIIGQSSVKNGIGATTIANKMCMALSVVCMILIYNEPVTSLKIVGILAGIGSVLFINLSSSNSKISKNGMLFLTIIFVGSGILDLVLNFANKPENLGVLAPSLFSAICFGVAGCIGITILTILLILGKTKIKLKNILGGIVLAIPNYFSIYFLLKSYTELDLDQSKILGINNILIVLFSTFLAIILFKEKITLIKGIGFGLAIIASVLLSLG